MPAVPDADPIAAIRTFNRFYTRQLGLLNEKLLNSEFTLTEARVLYELAQTNAPASPTQLSRDLVLDPGYLSRILKVFEARGLLVRTPSSGDGRQIDIALTPAGRDAFAPLNEASKLEVGELLHPLTAADQYALVGAMRTIQQIFDRRQPGEVTYRDLQLGDIGWIIRRQAQCYAEEYGWDASYEVLAAEILAAYVRNFQPGFEKSWIAVRHGQIVGSVFIARGSATVAKLRLLYVEPSARGLGVGHQLVAGCIAFAREAGYEMLSLWTNDVLVPARRIYQASGFTCVKREAHHSFGHDLVGETWELPLMSNHHDKAD